MYWCCSGSHFVQNPTNTKHNTFMATSDAAAAVAEITCMYNERDTDFPLW
jgi:hypothetical protein